MGLLSTIKSVGRFVANPIDAGLSAVGLGSPIGGLFGGRGSGVPVDSVDGRAADDAIAEFERMAKDTSGRLADVSKNPDQQLAGRYFDELNAPIQSEFMGQANQVSQYLARQGLGGSGINVAAHSGLANNAAALESQAKKQALDMAIEKEREGLLQSFSTRAAAMSPRLQKYGIDVSKVVAQMNINAQMQMLEQQMNSQMLSSGAELAGMAVLMSDGVVKTNIEYTGVDAMPGVPVVTWEYKGMPGVRFRGVIADDLEKVAPEWIRGDQYFKSVDYGFLDG